MTQTGTYIGMVAVAGGDIRRASRGVRRVERRDGGVREGGRDREKKKRVQKRRWRERADGRPSWERSI